MEQGAQPLGPHQPAETTDEPTTERIVIPLAEERLAVGTRQVDLGEVEIRKRVVEETVMQPVIVRREVVEIVRRDADGNEIVEEVRPPTTS
jgi:stress response protein YsnF